MAPTAPAGTRAIPRESPPAHRSVPAASPHQQALWPTLRDPTRQQSRRLNVGKNEQPLVRSRSRRWRATRRLSADTSSDSLPVSVRTFLPRRLWEAQARRSSMRFGVHANQRATRAKPIPQTGAPPDASPLTPLGQPAPETSAPSCQGRGAQRLRETRTSDFAPPFSIGTAARLPTSQPIRRLRR